MSIERFFVPGFELWRYTESSDELGNQVKVWSKVADLVGIMDAVTGTEQQVANAPQVTATHMFFTYADTNIREKDRIRYKCKEYNILFIDDPMNYGRFLQVSLELIR
ncbi:phage head closure protein [Thermoflavimicrobium dichotomicum]|uniref:Phage head-tail adaptor, putative, SPP1 family n=1 Tax=Thermoflavimicrobium dichotomicum TaxID=46223 RepID=A0A1I3UMP5_9BACL|nr:phage head closure protein [Thermoflavimicrobium dichotomicum]SFJ83196.1 phage head-tail adaptor, putative, SPP1 family [Thermoflavimicrobium dichotomicum]